MPGPWTFCLCKMSRNTNGAQRAWMPDRVESTEHMMGPVVTGYACAAPGSSLQLRLCLQHKQQTHGLRMPVSLSTVPRGRCFTDHSRRNFRAKGKGGNLLTKLRAHGQEECVSKDQATLVIHVSIPARERRSYLACPRSHNYLVPRPLRELSY